MVTRFVAVIGTRAQLIKMAPLVLEMERRGMPLELLMTGQHVETMGQLLADFGFQTQPRYLCRGAEVSGLGAVIPWLTKTLLALLRSACLAGGKNTIVLVHGDTFSTFLGALAGRLRRCRVAHIESGLRSFNLWHPFPEELTRLAVFRLASIAYCPGGWACENLQAFKSLRVVNTMANTLIDSVKFALSSPRQVPDESSEPFAIASIHRFENIFNEGQLQLIVELIQLAAKRCPLIFVLHPATKRKLQSSGLLAKLESDQNIRLSPRLSYLDFISLLSRAEFVITDGGGNQEELFYLGIPAFLMRTATERQEGVGRNVVLGEYSRDNMLNFLNALSLLRSPSVITETNSPSRIIADDLIAYCSK